MKKIIWIIILIAISVAAVSWFMPKPLGDGEIKEVVLVQANLNYGAQDSKLEYVHFIPDRITECLNKYKEQPTFLRHNGYAMKDVQLRILIRTDEGTKDIIIGKDTYSQKGTGPSYRILDREKFIKEIFDVCGYN